MNVKLLGSIAWMVSVFTLSAATSAQQVSAPIVGPDHSQSNLVDANGERVLSPQDRQVERAKILMAEKRYAAAIDAYQDLVKGQPKNAPFLNAIGIAYLNVGNPGQAKKYFERSAKADKKYSSAVNNLGMIWYQQNNYRRAIRQYRKAISIEPAQAGTHVNLAFAYYNTKKYPLAFAEFHTALELDPHALERNDRAGSMMQDRTVSNHGLFFFLMAPNMRSSETPNAAPPIYGSLLMKAIPRSPRREAIRHSKKSWTIPLSRACCCWRRPRIRREPRLPPPVSFAATRLRHCAYRRRPLLQYGYDALAIFPVWAHYRLRDLLCDRRYANAGACSIPQRIPRHIPRGKYSDDFDFSIRK